MFGKSFKSNSQQESQTPPVADAEKTEKTVTTTVLAAGTMFEGTIVTDNQIVVEGVFNGSISAGSLLVAPDAKVKAEVKVKTLHIHGTIEGNVHSTERVVMEATAKILGDVHYDKITMKEGSFIGGRMEKVDANGEKVVSIQSIAR